jgi:hypothetical protein
MSLKYGLLNFLLLCTALFLVLKNYEVWTRPMESIHENKEATKSYNKPEPVMISEKRNDSSTVNSHVSISEKNIFSPERKDFPTVAVNNSNPAVRPQVILYGVTIAGDFQAAFVVNPGRPLYKGERETKTIKVGDRVGGYKLAKILPDRITMEATGDSFDVLLYDPKVPKKRAETKIAEAKTVQPSPAATVEEAQKSVVQMTVDKTKEPAPERVTLSPPIRFQGNNLPIRVLSRQERSALISRRNASRK